MSPKKAAQDSKSTTATGKTSEGLTDEERAMAGRVTMTEQAGVVQLLCDLIALPSVNMEGRGESTGPCSGESRVADYVQHYFEPYGVRIERQEVYPGRENVLVQKTAGFEEFDDNARTALRAWRFEPLHGGRLGEQWGTITFHFRLRG